MNIARPSAIDRSALADFAVRLRRLRRESELSQRDLAAESGVTNTMIAFYELGHTRPSADAIAKLADAFGVTMDELWRGRKPRA
jgi:transcriptional regulator with XRE-family HTH domain